MKDPLEILASKVSESQKILLPPKELEAALSKVRLSPTALAQFDRCPREWFLSRVNRVQPRGSRINLDIGTQVHKAIEIFYRLWLHPLRPRPKEQARAIALWWTQRWVDAAREKILVEKQRELSAFFQVPKLLEAYFDYALWEEPGEVLAVEEAIRRNASVTSGDARSLACGLVLPFPAIGYPDKVVRDGDKIGLVNPKTTGQNPDRSKTISAMRMDYQVMFECCLFHDAYGSWPDFYRRDYLVKSQCRWTENDTEEKFLQRLGRSFDNPRTRYVPVTLEITQNDIRRFVRDCEYLIVEIIRVVENLTRVVRAGEPAPWIPRRPSACEMFGGCDYKPLCSGCNLTDSLPALTFERGPERH